jgi:hypothetical protein
MERRQYTLIMSHGTAPERTDNRVAIVPTLASRDALVLRSKARKGIVPAARWERFLSGKAAMLAQRREAHSIRDSLSISYEVPFAEVDGGLSS